MGEVPGVDVSRSRLSLAAMSLSVGSLDGERACPDLPKVEGEAVICVEHEEIGMAFSSCCCW